MSKTVFSFLKNFPVQFHSQKQMCENKKNTRLKLYDKQVVKVREEILFQPPQPTLIFDQKKNPENKV
jgi:hypothetical protein